MWKQITLYVWYGFAEWLRGRLSNNVCNSCTELKQLLPECNKEFTYFKVFHTNIRSIQRIFDELLVLLESFKLQNRDLILLTETCMHKLLFQSKIGMSTYLSICIWHTKFENNLQLTEISQRKLSTKKYYFKVNYVSFGFATIAKTYARCVLTYKLFDLKTIFWSLVFYCVSQQLSNFIK